ncbi:hypothetical protein [Thermorudis peleae]|jgi:hypothetical protein|nr:hypothetical protein [Thermorudis peleae]
MSRTTYPKGFPPKGEGRGRMWEPSRALFVGKLLFEKWWLWRYF